MLSTQKLFLSPPPWKTFLSNKNWSLQTCFYKTTVSTCTRSVIKKVWKIWKLHPSLWSHTMHTTIWKVFKKMSIIFCDIFLIWLTQFYTTLFLILFLCSQLLVDRFSSVKWKLSKCKGVTLVSDSIFYSTTVNINKWFLNRKQPTLCFCFLFN